MASNWYPVNYLLEIFLLANLRKLGKVEAELRGQIDSTWDENWTQSSTG